MNLEPSLEAPQVMHIDLNSAFAMAEQQANPLIRRRPVGVTNRMNDWAICITSSYEAKQLGIVLGTRVREAKLKAGNFVMVESDPAKYNYIHGKLRQIFQSYSPTAHMKSVDEGIIDFHGLGPILKGRPLEDIAAEIKRRIKNEVGDYMTVNIGIAQNRYLAKVAASFLKPDGLFTIDRDNLEAVYATMQLTELPYIKQRNQARLNQAGIYTPLEFYQTPEMVLTKQVFKSINGHHWYLKLRGYETEAPWGIRTMGRDYVLDHRTADPQEIATLLYKAAVKVSRRMRKYNLGGRGLALYLGYMQQRGYFQRRMYKVAAHRPDQIYARALEFFNDSPPGQVVKHLNMTCYGLEPIRTTQPQLFDDLYSKLERADAAINAVNDKYGELVVAPASVVKSKNPMPDKVPFGSTRYFD